MKKLFLSLLLALLALGLTQSANPPKSVQLECPAEVSAPSGFVNFDTHNLEGALKSPN